MIIMQPLSCPSLVLSLSLGFSLSLFVFLSLSLSLCLPTCTSICLSLHDIILTLGAFLPLCPTTVTTLPLWLYSWVTAGHGIKSPSGEKAELKGVFTLLGICPLEKLLQNMFVKEHRSFSIKFQHQGLFRHGAVNCCKKAHAFYFIQFWWIFVCLFNSFLFIQFKFQKAGLVLWMLLHEHIVSLYWPMAKTLKHV